MLKHIATEDLALLQESLVLSYDGKLLEKTGIRHYQGRTEAERVDTWAFLRSQKDLLGFYFDALQEMAASPYDDVRLEKEKKRLTISVWAAVRERLDNRKRSAVPLSVQVYAGMDDPRSLDIAHEVLEAGNRAAARYETMMACGGVMSMENGFTEDGRFDIFAASPENAMNFIVNSEDKSTWTYGEGFCRVEACPSGSRKTRVGPCQVCMSCQSLFDQGKTPQEEYKKRASAIRRQAAMKARAKPKGKTKAVGREDV
jgi:hypothetical protein